MGEKLMQSVSLRIRTMLHELHDAVFLPQSAPPQVSMIPYLSYPCSCVYCLVYLLAGCHSPNANCL